MLFLKHQHVAYIVSNIYNMTYFGGGSSTSMVDRLNYSNDNTKTLIRGPLTFARNGLAATGNSNFGYFGGGGNPSSGPYGSENGNTNIVRIDYSNDLVTALYRNNLSTNRYTFAATGNSNNGYFNSGLIPGVSNTSRTERIDYSNDTNSLSIRGSTLSSFRRHAGFTNARNS